MSYTIEILKKCSDLYYNSDELLKLNASECEKIEEELNQNIFDSYPIEITDSLYDMIALKAKAVFPNDSYWLEVGATATGYGIDIKLPFTAGSLEELHQGDFDNWVFKRNHLTISAKLDGCSCVLHFANGKLVNAISRGDGLVGKDITRHYLKSNNAITEISIKDDIWIRGELIIPKEQFEYIKTISHYKVARNTVAGIINAKEPAKPVIANSLHFLAYHIDSDTFKTNCEESMFIWLKQEGFETPIYRFHSQEQDKLSEPQLIKMVKELKESYEYEIDGIVLTVDEHELWNGFETGTINPKYSRKFKIGAITDFVETSIIDIKWNVSKHGLYKPTIIINPVIIDGVTISQVTGNNYKFVKDNDFYIGKKVCIKRAGLVIPQIFNLNS